MLNYEKDGVLKTIFPYIKGKEVLDVGCIEHSLENKDIYRVWVHDFLREHAKHVTGIDILKKDIEILKKQGYDVYCQNAETFSFNKKFDIIFAGELIEHLSNPGLFLDRCKKHLKKDGFLILTTPNAFSVYRFLCIIKDYTNNPTVNNEHVSWFSPSVIRHLFERYNFQIENMEFFNYPLKKPALKHRLVSIICNILGDKFRETMIVISK